jgi:phytoene dehydrogenase-like protein
MKQTKPTRREFVQLATAAAFSMSLGCISNKFVDKLAEEGKKPEDYPVVVIGSGIGGLASAVYLSKAGFPVTVIEQHSVPGGYATAFSRGDFNFDVSLHWFTLQEELYKELGLEGKVERIPLDRTWRVVGKNRDITIPNLSPEKYVDFMCTSFPDEKEGIRKFYDFCFAVLDEMMKFSKKAETGYIFIPLMPFQYPKMWSMRETSFADVLKKYIKDTKVQSSIARICAIFGLPPSQTSGLMATMLVASMLKEKSYYFRSRSQDLTNALVEVIEDHKGKVILEKTVTKILTEKDRVTGVQTEDGATYPAKIVVSNANAPDTFGKFLSGNAKAKKHMEKLAQYSPSISSFMVWLGLKGELRGKVKGHGITIASGYDIETDFQNFQACDADKCPVMIAMYDNYFKGYSKPGTSTLTVFTLSGYEPWRKFEKDYFAGNKAAYNREKERIARTLIKRVEKAVIPGLSKKIKVMEASTPLTNLRFTKNPGGAIYGYPPSVNNAYTNRVKNSTPIQGLYLSSGWGSYWGSYPGGIMNGRDVYRMIMKEI